MRSLFLQLSSVIAINLKSLPQRFWLALTTVVAITLVVMVLLAFLAMANGFQQTMRGSGADDVAILLRGGSETELNSGVLRDQIRLIEEAPGVARSAEGKPLVSGELYVVVDGLKRSSQTKANLPLRGIGPEGAALRPNVRIAQGRMFAQGANEIIVGKALLNEFTGFSVGDKVRFGVTEWTVVGVFEAGGSVFESELWADLAVVQSLFNRQNVFQTVRAKLTSPAALQELKAFSEADPRLKLDVRSENDYFAKQAGATTGIIQYLGWPLAVLMAIGALAGALNTMYSSVQTRTAEIATLRAIGFGGFATFIGTLVESLVLSVIGGALGALATWLIFDGLTTATLGASFTQVVFSFKLSPDLFRQGILLALAIGVLGGLFPGIRAARVPLTAAFER